MATLDDVMDCLAHVFFKDGTVPVTTFLGFGEARVRGWLRVPEDRRVTVRTDVTDLLKSTDAPCAMLSWLLRYHSFHKLAFCIGASGNVQLLELVGELDSDDLREVIRGCAATDDATLLRSIFERYIGSNVHLHEWIVRCGIENGANKVLDYVCEVTNRQTWDDWQGWFLGNVLKDTSPPNADMARWIARRAPWARGNLQEAVLRDSRADLLEADPDLLWDESVFVRYVTLNKHNAYFSEAMLRFARDRMDRGAWAMAVRLNASTWLFATRQHEARSFDGLAFLVRSGAWRLTSSCFLYVNNAAELREIVDMGAPWPQSLRDIAEDVVDDAVVMPECPMYRDWALEVLDERGLRACLERGWPVPPDLFATYRPMRLNVTKLQILVNAGAAVSPVVAEWSGHDIEIFQYVAERCWDDALWDGLKLREEARLDWHVNVQKIEWCIERGHRPTDAVVLSLAKVAYGEDAFRAAAAARGIPEVSPDVGVALLNARKFQTLAWFVRNGGVIDERVTSRFPLREILM